MIWIFDIELYPNYFGCIFKNPNTNELKEFIIFGNRNDLDELNTFITDKSNWLVGYNSYNYDNQILNYIYKFHRNLILFDTDDILSELYDLSSSIINSEEFGLYKYNLPFNYIDLMKVGYLFKSLKLVGVNLKWHKLQDLPIPPSQRIKESDLQLLHEYNLNDVEITEKLYEYLLDEIKLRWDVSKAYKIDGYSESRSGLANRLLEKFYSETTGLPIKAFKDIRTERPYVSLKYVVFKNVSFETDILEDLLERIVTSSYYATIPFVKKTVVFDNIKYNIGIGGLHSNDSPGIFEETEDEYLIDADVSSMYPSIITSYQIHPAHLDYKFILKYKEIKDLRIEAKKRGDKLTAEVFKIVLNATYG